MSITAADIRAWIGAYASAVTERRAELVKLDTAIGDGDHGTNMDRGMTAVVGSLADDAPPFGVEDGEFIQ